MTTLASKPYTVSSISKLLSSKVEPFFYGICVIGEVTNITRQASGHLYFSIKDDKAQLNIVMFKKQAMLLKKLPAAGDKVVVKGDIRLYAMRSTYQLIAFSLTPSGMGEALIELQRRKEKYEQLGWFSTSLKKPLPPFPKRVGIVTSPTGAAIRDILQILTRRHPLFHAIIYPSLVQGPGAASEVAKGIDQLNQYGQCDLIIVARGGGSFEDLYAFNEEVVIEAVHTSKLPVISAVGHETDTTLIDFISDKREPTPSAAASAVCYDFAQLFNNIAKAGKLIYERTRALVEMKQRDLRQMRRHPCFAEESSHLFIPMQALDQIHLQLSANIQQKLEEKRAQLAEVARSIQMAFENHFSSYLMKLNMAQKHLRALSPLTILEKGYAIAFCEKKQSVIINTQGLEAGDKLTLRLRTGSLKVEIKEIL